MRANKQSALVMVACVFAATSTAAYAGGGNLGTAQSALDPENFVAPTPSHSAHGGNIVGVPTVEPQEEIQSTTTFVTMPGQENRNVVEKPHKVAKAAKAPKEQKQHVEEVKEAKAPAAASNDKGLVSDVGDKFKSAGSGLASGTKAAGDKMKEGSKVVGEGITNGAKASGSFFMKGAKAMGSSTKKMGSKVAQGAKAAGDAMKDGTHAVADHIPFTGKGGKDEAAETKAVASKQDDLKPAGKAEEKSAAPTKVAAVDSKKEEKMKLKTEEVKDKGPGLMDKTLGSFNKLNVFHKKDSNLTAGKAPNGAIFTH